MAAAVKKAHQGVAAVLASERRYSLAQGQPLFLLLPDFRLRRVTTDPEREKCWRDAEEEDAAPADEGEEDGGNDRGQSVTGGEGALHSGHHLASMPSRPSFRNQRRARGPFPTDAEPDDDAEQKELRDVLRQAAEDC